MSIDGKTILITGGTGSFGKAFVKALLTRKPKKVIIFSRDELKQFEMQQEYGDHPALRFFLGDVRDTNRLNTAFYGVDIVVHAAALKQVPMLEYNPFEAIKTNVVGAENIINVAISQGVQKVLALSTDKAVNPINLYGASKLCAEKLFVVGNYYAATRPTRFSVVRYGNVLGSRGSVIPFFLKKKPTGVLPITHKDMTRFWITLDRSVSFVLESIDHMQGGEVFVPKIPSMKIIDLARAIAPECRHEFVGIRAGEKLHEVLLMEDEARHSVEFPDRYVIEPESIPAYSLKHASLKGGKPVPAASSYASDTNSQWLTVEDLRSLIQREHLV